MHAIASKQTLALISICIMIILMTTLTEACPRGVPMGCLSCWWRKKREAPRLPDGEDDPVACFKKEQECLRKKREFPCPKYWLAYCEKSYSCTGDDTIGLFCVVQ